MIRTCVCTMYVYCSRRTKIHQRNTLIKRFLLFFFSFVKLGKVAHWLYSQTARKKRRKFCYLCSAFLFWFAPIYFFSRSSLFITYTVRTRQKLPSFILFLFRSRIYFVFSLSFVRRWLWNSDRDICEWERLKRPTPIIVRVIVAEKIEILNYNYFKVVFCAIIWLFFNQYSVNIRFEMSVAGIIQKLCK